MFEYNRHFQDTQKKSYYSFETIWIFTHIDTILQYFDEFQCFLAFDIPRNFVSWKSAIRILIEGKSEEYVEE